MKQQPLTVKQMDLLLKLCNNNIVTVHEQADARVLLSRGLIQRSSHTTFQITENGSRTIDLMKAVTSVY